MTETAPHSPPPAAGNDLLTTLLQGVSRSFYLTLRVLPVAIRPQIGLAYLLARTTDTIADTAIVPVPDRLATLDALRERILGLTSKPADLHPFLATEGNLGAPASPAERILLARVEETLQLLEALPEGDRKQVRQVLDIITTGQMLDLQRFGDASSDRIVTLADDAELDDYTYRVAGCVGEFWTRLCRAHLFPLAVLDDQFLLTNGVRFGKGLQLVNVLRDLPADLRQGRCYIPADGLKRHGLTPSALLEPAGIGRFRNLYDTHLARAREHLAAGWNYTNSLPRNEARVRLACAWPILIGVRTLSRLRTGNVLDARQRIKVGRAEVRGLVLRSLLCYPFPAAWDRLFEHARLGSS